MPNSTKERGQQRYVFVPMSSIDSATWSWCLCRGMCVCACVCWDKILWKLDLSVYLPLQFFWEHHFVHRGGIRCHIFGCSVVRRIWMLRAAKNEKQTGSQRTCLSAFGSVVVNSHWNVMSAVICLFESSCLMLVCCQKCCLLRRPKKSASSQQLGRIFVMDQTAGVSFVWLQLASAWIWFTLQMWRSQSLSSCCACPLCETAPMIDWNSSVEGFVVWFQQLQRIVKLCVEPLRCDCWPCRTSMGLCALREKFGAASTGSSWFFEQISSS